MCLSAPQTSPVADSLRPSGSSTISETQSPSLLDAVTVARVTGLSLRTIYGYVTRGRIPSIKFGDHRLFKASDVRAWIADREQRRSRCAATNVALPASVDAEGCLSRREREVLGLILTGATKREIVGRLSISPLTIDVHRRHIRTKLHVSRIVDLIARYGVVNRGTHHA